MLKIFQTDSLKKRRSQRFEDFKNLRLLGYLDLPDLEVRIQTQLFAAVIC